MSNVKDSELAVGITQHDSPAGVIDLGPGYLDPDLVPVEMISRWTADALDRWGPAALAYGANIGPHGLRAMLAARTVSQAAPGNVAITAGTSAALDQLAGSFAASGRAVLTEALTYDFGREIFAGWGLEVIAVPGPADDIDVGQLRSAARQAACSAGIPPAIYLIPTFHNPTGRVLSATRRAELLAVAEETGALIIEDLAYAELAYPSPPTPPSPPATPAPPTTPAASPAAPAIPAASPAAPASSTSPAASAASPATPASPAAQASRSAAAPPPSLWATAADPAQVVSLYSFAKCLAPGLRLGWLVSGEERVAELAASPVRVSGGGPNHLTAMTVMAGMASGEFDAHVSGLRGQLKTRRDYLVAALLRELPDGCTLTEPEGGFFIWVTLPNGISDEELLVEATKRGVTFALGSRFGGSGDSARLCFAGCAPEQLSHGAVLFAQACNTLLARSPQ